MKKVGSSREKSRGMEWKRVSKIRKKE